MNKSEQYFIEAEKYLPGGVNSPVRAFKSVGLDPVFIDHAHGAYVYDVDGNQYIDYICSWGPLILGHSPKIFTEDIQEVVAKGTSYGLPTEIEVEMAKLVVESYPGIDQVRMVNSGTEATMSALRLARGYTGRNKFIKFEGCYHGHSDSLLIKSGSGALTYGVPTSPGVPQEVIADTLVARFNDIDSVRALFAEQGDDIAAIIVEPVAANMGVIEPADNFLQALRDVCDEYGALLIFDEVITGFRLDYHSAAGFYGVTPDMVCFGKIIGGGLPVGAYGGRREIMKVVSPEGPVYQAGTLSGNPLAMYMGKQQLTVLRDHPEIYTFINQQAEKLAVGMRQNIQSLGLNLTVHQVESLVCLFFNEGPICDYDDVMKSDNTHFKDYFAAMLEQGIMIAPAPFESMFISAKHDDELIEKTIQANYNALKKAFNK